MSKRETAADAAVELVDKHGVEMIELCGGLGNAHIVALVKKAINDKVPVGNDEISTNLNEFYDYVFSMIKNPQVVLSP